MFFDVLLPTSPNVTSTYKLRVLFESGGHRLRLMHVPFHKFDTLEGEIIKGVRVRVQVRLLHTFDSS